MWWNHQFLKNKKSFYLPNKMLILSSLIKLILKFGLNSNSSYFVNTLFWANFSKFFLIKNASLQQGFNLIKVKIKINKKSFNTYYKRSVIKFLHPSSVILINYKNCILAFIHFFKAKETEDLNKWGRDFGAIFRRNNLKTRLRSTFKVYSF